MIAQYQRLWLNAMRVNVAPMVACFVAIPFFIASFYVFIYLYELEVIGIGLAYSVYGIVLAISMQIVLFFFVSEVREAYTLPTKEALSGWQEYVSLAIPAVLCNVLNMTFEVAILLAGTINETE